MTVLSTGPVNDHMEDHSHPSSTPCVPPDRTGLEVGVASYVDVAGLWAVAGLHV